MRMLISCMFSAVMITMSATMLAPERLSRLKTVIIGSYIFVLAAAGNLYGQIVGVPMAAGLFLLIIAMSERYRLENGKSGRVHLGLGAQDVERALAEAGLDGMDFGGFVKSPREDGGFDYALRYGEFIPMCIARIQELTARVAKLEGRFAS